MVRLAGGVMLLTSTLGGLVMTVTHGLPRKSRLDSVRALTLTQEDEEPKADVNTFQAAQRNLVCATS